MRQGRPTNDEIALLLREVAKLKTLEADERDREAVTGRYRRLWTLSAPAAVLFSGKAREEEQEQAAVHLAAAVGWIGRRRIEAHQCELQAELLRRAADAGRSVDGERRATFARAFRIVAVDARRPQERLRTDGRFVYRNAPPDGPGEPAVPTEDVGFAIFHNWATTRVADEVMGDLLPDWRRRERETRQDVEIIPMDGLEDGRDEAPRAPSVSARRLIALLEGAPREDIELAQLIYVEGKTSREAGAQLGISAGAARMRSLRLRRLLDVERAKHL